jgi:alkanesulfonate monooxygenase SsuD/methylene tetrahydromethanopterin reductase-like flavin-dependent oxidoreductase (luciferase family)
VTERIGLATMIAIGPLRNAALLAKQAASVDALSGKRLTWGLAVGARLDDYETAQVDHRGRGPRLSEQLAALRDGDDLGVREDLPLLVGGMVGPAFARMARYADGYAHNGGPPRAFARATASARAAWSDLDRPGRPLLWGQALAPATRTGRRHRALLRVHRPVRGADRRRQPHPARAIRDFVRGYEEPGAG